MGDSEHPPVYEFEGFRLDMRRRTLATLDGRAAPLPPKTLDALCHLVAHAGEVVGKRELLEAVWPHVVVEENNLNQAISQLRRALGERPNEHRYIVTEPGRGYRFVAAVSVARTEEVPSVDAPPAPRSEPSRRAVAVLAIATALAAGAAGLWWYAGQPPGPLPNSVAVLPFENLNPSPSNVAFASGLHGEIVSQLAKISSLIVIGASGEGPAREVAAELNVETVLHATVEFADGRVRIRPQLVSGATGQTLWAQSYDERFADILAIESEIAAQVANALRAEFSVAEQTAVDTPPTESPEAYEAYVRARGVRAINPDLALQYLDEATQLDPGFALAYAAKAEQLAGRFIAQVGREAADPAEWDELERRIRAAANEALRIDGDL
ncbi:MAG TPA: winged helix-turn-helix domain-containing protein, partial [Gammaproteobacteria bacterium]|nr:winged helix-turn-helix domain-containing protein [Gammaproteobacteria bacterium]